MGSHYTLRSDESLLPLPPPHPAAGVYNADLRKHYTLRSDDWKYDVMPELLDGHNVLDFVDPDIDARLAELEREEEELEVSGGSEGGAYLPDRVRPHGQGVFFTPPKAATKAPPRYLPPHMLHDLTTRRSGAQKHSSLTPLSAGPAQPGSGGGHGGGRRGAD